MADEESTDVVRLREIGLEQIAELLAPYGLVCAQVDDNEPIPGSFWGDPEAGLDGDSLLARADTPVHSMLHEACHYVCMTPQRRADLHTDAGGDFAEENGACYLQVLLADFLPALGRERVLRDMDAWGYSFRLGSARAWFEADAEDAYHWLLTHRLVDPLSRPTWTLRQL